LKEERISWTVEGQTLELQTLETQQQTLHIKELLIEQLLDKCIVPVDYNKRNNKDSIDRVNKIIERVEENKIIEPIVVLQDRRTKKIIRILDGSHRVRVYKRLGKKKILGKIIEVEMLTENQRRVLLVHK